MGSNGTKGARWGFRSQGYRQTHNLQVLAGQTARATEQARWLEGNQVALLQQLVVEQQRTNQLLVWLGQSQGFPPPPA